MIYFDNRATTNPCRAAVQAAARAMEDVFGNPASSHGAGIAARAELKAAREEVASSLHVTPDEIYFTSGGTMSDNIAVFGGAKKGVGNHAVTTKIEHEAVLLCFEELEKRGFDVTYLTPESDGNISLSQIEKALTPETSLVSIMTVNNETGAMLPVDGVKALINRICPRALFHTDAVQAFGKTELYPDKWGVDLLSVSGHKVHAPKGVGALYIRRGVSLLPHIFGGGQEKNIHSGTENLPGIMGLAAAVREFDIPCKTVSEINAYMRRGISKLDGAEINSPEDASPYVLNVSFGKIPSEVMLNAMAAEGICASAGSACAANRSGESYVLRAMGRSPKSAIRFSFSRFNTLEEAEKTMDFLNKTVPLLTEIAGR